MNMKWKRCKNKRSCLLCRGLLNCWYCTTDRHGFICSESGKTNGTVFPDYLHGADCKQTPHKRKESLRGETKTRPGYWEKLHNQYVASIRHNHIGSAFDIDLGFQTNREFEVGCKMGRHTIPLRQHDGSICGFQLLDRGYIRPCETGSEPGLFFVPGALSQDYLLIVLGASDAMAAFEMGYPSVIGCDERGDSREQILALTHHLKPKKIVIIPDNDYYGFGWVEAKSIEKSIRLFHSVQILKLADGLNDVSDCFKNKEDGDWLFHRIEELVSTSEQGKVQANV